jgi:hypothetical protein
MGKLFSAEQGIGQSNGLQALIEETENNLLN